MVIALNPCMKRTLSLLALLCFFGNPLFAQEPVTSDSIPKADSLVVFMQENLVRDSADLSLYVVEDTLKYTFEMIQKDIDFFETTWPQYVHSTVIGYSEYGLPLRGFSVSKNNTPKPLVFMVGNIHAREDYSSKMAMKVANVMLLSLDGKSDIYPRISSMLDSVDIYFLPVANPDGLKIAHSDFSGIENHVYYWLDTIDVEETVAEWKANGKGVDLNCSFDDGNWEVKKGGNAHFSIASEGYKGSAPAEPLETKAIQHFIQKHKPLCTLSFHTKGEILYWADAMTHQLFENIDTEMSNEARQVSKFELGKIGTKPSDFGAGLENYVRSRSGSIGVCVELSCGGGGRKQHADSLFNDLVWNKAWLIPMVYVENTVQHKQELLRIQGQFYKMIEAQKP